MIDVERTQFEKYWAFMIIVVVGFFIALFTINAGEKIIRSTAVSEAFDPQMMNQLKESEIFQKKIDRSKNKIYDQNPMLKK